MQLLTISTLTDIFYRWTRVG